MNGSFQKRVWQVCAQIPRGRVTTYQLLAKILGSPRACRAVGNALNKNPQAPQVPCHRVVRSDGQIGGYANGQAAKARILRQEGIQIDNKNRVVDFAKTVYEFKVQK